MVDDTMDTDATVQALSNLASLAERHIFRVDGAAITLLEHVGIHRGASNEMAREVDKALLESGRCQAGARVIIAAGSPPGIPGSTNALRVHRIGDAKNKVAPAYEDFAVY